MHNRTREPYWFETAQVGSQDSPSDRLVDVGDRDSVLDFTNRYLESYSLPKNIDEVHNVTAAISRYKGPRIVRWATLESFVAGLVSVQRD